MRLVEVLVVLALLLNAALAVSVGVSLALHWPGWTRERQRTAQVPSAPLPIHAPAPASEAGNARADSCRRLDDLLREVNGQLIRSGLTQPLSNEQLVRLLAETSCQLDDPKVREALKSLRDAFREAGQEPPPALPRLED